MMITDNEEEKRIIRQKISRLRDEINLQERITKSQLACKHTLAQPFFANHYSSAFPTISMYMPFRSELDISPIMEWCWEQGWKVLIPKVVKDQSNFILYRVTSYDEMELGMWGIREPNHKAEEWDRQSIDLMFIPGIAFDRQGGRLGFGGGYYDRFMTSYNELNLAKPILTAVAFDLQIVNKVPMEKHDFTVENIVTESGAQL